MRERSIAVRLRAEVSDFNRQIGSAATSLDDVVKKAGQGEKAADTFMGRVAQSAQLQRQAWTTVGSTLAVAGAAVTGLGAAVLNTGVSYNTLRQTSVAALTTLTGSAEAANAQMDRLDAFASTSPFARDVFIRAQQQMLAFGIEAERVIPYLDAIQNAVAAAGGSNQDIAEIAEIFGKISAQGKITAVDLMQFGRHGVDAATLIGSQMDMTGAQIRQSITDGSLDAGMALDALAAGMDTRFEGAADNVKATFAGAVDRVQAAWRDISSIVAEPLVSRDGGGLAVGGLNALADAMRAFEDLPDPVIQVGGAIGMLGGVATTAAGALLLAVPRFVEFRTSLVTLSDAFPGASRVIGGFTGAVGRLAGAAAIIGVTTVAFGALANALSDPGTVRDAESLADEILRITDAGRSLEELHIGAIFEEMPTSFGMTAIEARNLGDALDTLADPGINGHISQFFGDLGLPSWMDRTAEAVAGTDEALRLLVEAGHADLVAQLLERTGHSSEFLAERMPETTGALEELGVAGEGAAEGVAEADEALEDLAEALAGTSAGFVDVMGAWDAVIEKNREVAQSAADAAGDSEASWEDFYDGHSVNLSEYLSELQRQVDAQAAWQENMLILAGRVSQGTLDELSRLGPEGAPLIAALVDASPEELARFEELMAAGSADASAAFAAGLIEAIPLMRTAMTSMSNEAIAQLAADLAAGETTVQEAMDAYDLNTEAEVEITAEPRKARTILDGLVAEIDGSTGVLTMDGDPVNGMQTLDAFLRSIGASAEDVTIDGDPVNGNAALQLFINRIRAAEEDVTIDGDNANGVYQLERLVDLIRKSQGYVDVDADTSDANHTMRNWSPGSKNVSVGADLSAARQSIANWSPSKQIRIYGQAAVATGGYMGDFASAMGLAAGGVPRRMLGGGSVFGPGTATSDSIPTWLSNGEFVQQARAVQKYGLEFHRAVNAGQFPVHLARGYRDGGHVGRPEYADRQYLPQYNPAQTPAAVSVAAPAVQVFIGDEEVTGRVRVVVRDEMGAAVAPAGRRMRAAGVGG